MSEQTAVHFVEVIASEAEDEQVADQLRAVKDTYCRRVNGSSVIGIDSLRALVDEKVLERVLEWLEVESRFAGEPAFCTKLTYDSIPFEHEVPVAGWTQPDSLPADQEIPAFPVTAMPPELAAYAFALAEDLQVPVDMVCVLILGAISTCIGGKIHVYPKQGWPEILGIFAVVLMEPGSRKTAAFNRIVSPIKQFERERKERFRATNLELKNKRDVLEHRLKLLKAETAKDVDGHRDNEQVLERKISMVTNDLSALPKMKGERIYSTDITSETLATRMCEQDGRFSIMSSETSFFSISSGRYSDDPNIENILSGHSGDSIIIDRQGRSESTPSPCLTLVLTTLIGRGLLDRFIYCVPKSNIDFRKTETFPTPKNLEHYYSNALLSIAQLYYDLPEHCELHLAEAAKELFTSWRTANELKRRPNGAHSDFVGWSAKEDGLCMRIAALLQVAKQPHLRAVEIDELCLRGAIAICDHLALHAAKAMAMISLDSRYCLAIDILRWACANRAKEVSTRECARRFRANREQILQSLSILEDHGYVQCRRRRVHLNGRPMVVAILNPLLLRTEATEATEPTLPLDHDSYSVDKVAFVPTVGGEDCFALDDDEVRDEIC